jgi:threonine dehydrogenase-like Zn-dependent dehydrogenase/glycosyltransferase involved in cell wall biosynthesis
MRVSVIVRAYNEERHLPNLMQALERQSFRDFETILVDSGSVDRTRQIATAHGARVLRINSHDFTFGYSLNMGIRAAAGEIAAIVSAHAIPTGEHWLEHLIRPFGEPKTAMTYGRQLGISASKFSEIEDFRRVFGTRRLVLTPPHWFANNANSAVRRDLWSEHAFDECLTGLEDVDWARYWMERGFAVRYEPDAAVYHVHEESWLQVRHRHYREAVAARDLTIRTPADIPRQIAAELLHTVADFGRAVFPGSNPAAERLSLPKRWSEIALFRANKVLGIVKGLGERRGSDTREKVTDMLFERTGRAVVIEAPGKATLSDISVPELRPGDVLIRVAHVAICATDVEILHGTLGYFQNGLAQYPQVPGHEFSGRIAGLGQNVRHLSDGDPVVAECIQSCGICEHCKAGNPIGCEDRTELGVFRHQGAYADYVVVPARFVHKLPDELDLTIAALVEPTAVILKGLRRVLPFLAKIPPHRVSVGVVGAGPLGHICARVLDHRGFRVCAFDRSSARLENFSGTRIETSTDLHRLRTCTLIIEVTGNRVALEETLRQAPAGAAILLLGLPYGEQPFSFETIVAYDKVVVGSVGSTAEDFAAAVELLPSIDLEPLLRRRMPLEDFLDGWKLSKDENVLKVILDVSPEVQTA